MADRLEELFENFDNDVASTTSNGYYSASGSSTTGNVFENGIGMVDEISELLGNGPVQILDVPPIPEFDPGSERYIPTVIFKPSEAFTSACDRMHKLTSTSTRRYISNVIRCESFDQASGLCRQLRIDAEGTYVGGLLIIRQHQLHVHCVHLCAYSGSHCRCAFIEKAKSRGELRQPISRFRRQFANRLSATDCQNILQYFTEGGDIGETIIIIGGSVEGKLCGDKVLEKQRHSNNPGGEKQHSLEACLQISEIELRSPIEIRDAYEQGRSSRLPRDLESGRGNKTAFQRRVLDVCKMNPVTPIRAIVNHIVWLSDDMLMFKRNDDKMVQSVLDTFSQTICKWSLDEFYAMYTAPGCIPCFSAIDGRPQNLYYNREQSVDILVELLQFQYDDDELAIMDFLYDVWAVVERKLAKCNCICVVSPPSGGKNFFFDTILAFCLNKGQLGNPNKYNHFAFQEAYGKRIILWNEPNYESSQTDMLKLMLGGDQYTVNVKCKHDCAVEKTPIICLSNKRVPFMMDIAFKDRIRLHTWKTAPILKRYTKKPHPMAIYLLFKRYNVFE